MSPDTSPGALPLPGLDALDERTATASSALARAVRRTIAALDAEGHIAERDAARLQLAIEMAEVIDLQKTSRRMSTIGHTAKVLAELLDQLVPPATEVDDDLKRTIAEWNAIEAERRAAGLPVDPP